MIIDISMYSTCLFFQRETQQKLIYSGKLLNDEQTLKDVIRQVRITLGYKFLKLL